MTVAEVTLAFELRCRVTLKLILLLILAIWKAIARRDVLHASQVRALAAAADLYRAVAPRGDSRDRGDHGEGILARALLELTKPRITQLVLLTAAAGFYLGAHGRVDLLLLANTMIGTALVAGGTNAWNQIREREVFRSAACRAARRLANVSAASAAVIRFDVRTEIAAPSA